MVLIDLAELAFLGLGGGALGVWAFSIHKRITRLEALREYDDDER